jgi:hypothetical protein
MSSDGLCMLLCAACFCAESEWQAPVHCCGGYAAVCCAMVQVCCSSLQWLAAQQVLPLSSVERCMATHRVTRPTVVGWASLHCMPTICSGTVWLIAAVVLLEFGAYMLTRVQPWLCCFRKLAGVTSLVAGRHMPTMQATLMAGSQLLCTALHSARVVGRVSAETLQLAHVAYTICGSLLYHR